MDLGLFCKLNEFYLASPHHSFLAALICEPTRQFWTFWLLTYPMVHGFGWSIIFVAFSDKASVASCWARSNQIVRRQEIFKNNNFFCFTLSYWSHIPKNMFLSPKLRLSALKGPLGPLRALVKGPLNSSKTKIFKNNNFFTFTLSHWAYWPKIMFLSPKLRLLALKGPLGHLLKGP